MPPKKPSKNIRGRRSQNTGPETVPIYSILTLFDNPNAVRDITRKLEALHRHDEQAVERSLITMVMECCGLEQLAHKINWRQPAESLSELLKDASENKNKKTAINPDFYLINFRSKFHKQFSDRLTKLMDVVLSDQLPFLSETEFLRISFDILRVISQSKLRNIRASAVELSSIFISRKSRYYDELVTNRNSKKAAKILTILEEGYFQEIVKPRVHDIDHVVRETAFSILHNTCVVLQMEFITLPKLKQFFDPLLLENKSKKVLQSCLKTIISLLGEKRVKDSARKNLVKYCVEILPSIEEIAMLPEESGALGIQLLKTMNYIDRHTNSLKPKTIGRAFQIHASQNNREALKKLVQGFFQSLIEYKTKQQMLEHRQFLTVQILHLLSSINSIKLLRTIIKQFLFCWEKLFNFQEFFVLLFTESYVRDDSEVQLHPSAISVLLHLICEFNAYLKAKKQVSDETEEAIWINEEKLSYNKYVLINSKEIIFAKMEKLPALANFYLKLFSNIFTPVEASFDGYMDFVLEKTLSIVNEEKYVVMGNQKITSMQQIVRECSAICSNLMNSMDPAHYSRVLKDLYKAFSIKEILKKCQKKETDLIDLEALKVAALISKIEPQTFIKVHLMEAQQIQNSALLDESIFRQMINRFEATRNTSVKLEVITYLYCVHQLMFQDLFKAPNEEKYRQYISYRNVILDFLLQGILEGSSPSSVEGMDENSMIKFAVFTTLCKIFKFISSNKISDLPIVYYDPTQRNLDIFLGYVSNNLMALFGDRENPSQGESTINNLSVMLYRTQLDSVSSSGIQFVEQILANLFEMLEGCTKIVGKKQNVNVARIIALFLSFGNELSKDIEQAKPQMFQIYNLLGIEQKVEGLFVRLAQFEVQEQNKNRFLFWKLFDSVMVLLNQVPQDFKIDKEEDKQAILAKMVELYFRYRKNHSQTHKALSDKMMLYVADSIDKIMAAKRFDDLGILRMLLKKIYRRYNKEILHRLSRFFSFKVEIAQKDGAISKTSEEDEDGQQMVNVDEKEIKLLKKYLQKISKTGKQTKRKVATQEAREGQHNSDQGDSNSGSDSEDDKKSEEAAEEITKEQKEGVRTRHSNRMRMRG